MTASARPRSRMQGKIFPIDYFRGILMLMLKFLIIVKNVCPQNNENLREMSHLRTNIK